MDSHRQSTALLLPQPLLLNPVLLRPVLPSLVLGLLLIASAALAPAAQAEDPPEPPQHETAIFAGGCFWCMESAFDAVEGVVATTSGYTGGKTKDPTYKSVKLGTTGHYESLKVTYDPMQVSYEQLLDVFWHNIDPFNARGQFCDRGSQYRAAIFVSGEPQRSAAEASREEIATRTKHKIVTEILPVSTFYEAEEYHQNYYQKNPLKYRYYRYTCGRDQRLREIWGSAAGH